MRTTPKLAAVIVALLVPSLPAFGQEALPEAASPTPSIFQHMLVSNGLLFGPLMLFLALAMLALIVALAVGLRPRRPGEGDCSPAWRSRHERTLRWLGGLGVLSPLLGLLGTLLGTMLLCMQLARHGGEAPNALLIRGLSHVLPVLLEGLFLACVAIPAYVLFKNRLQRLC
jgi:hypothetical protein